MSLAMTKEEREAFLAGLHVGVLGVNHGDVPLTVPIWYDYEAGGDVWVITSRESIKGKALDTSGRFSLCAQTEDLPYKYVTVEGSVLAVEPASHDALLDMATRYLGPEIGTRYAEANAGTEGNSALYRLRPERWYTADYGKETG
jgi:nitroimidazol reductase NimA-like FMN-containing flavoprotein (pyridoxamine 5'-phosphate oxidase superfamily)